MTPQAITWLDFSESEQKQMRELLNLFSGGFTIDDLGIGTIRDSISNTLFPGTSTLHTRARYFLFIPWIFQEAERRHKDQLVAKANDMERKLILALKDGVDGKDADDWRGLIGIDAGINVRTLPSAIYWSALQQYKIFRFPSLAMRSYGRAVANHVTAADFEGELADRSASFWNRSIPPAPDDFFKFVESDFQMTSDESEWLCNRIVDSESHADEQSLLASLVAAARTGELEIMGDAPWETPLPGGVSVAAKRVLEQAKYFSLLVEGAALLYNLMLAERLDERDLPTKEITSPEIYRSRLSEWGKTGASLRLQDWSANISELWTSLPFDGQRIPSSTRKFVTEWSTEVARCELGVAASSVARSLIEDREKEHKRGQSRFRNQERLKSWAGEAGTGSLVFRWPQIKQTVTDIANGLERPIGS